MEFKQSWAVLQEKHPGFCALLRTIYSSEDPVDAKMTRARQALEYMLQARCLSLHRAYTDIHKTLGMLQQKGDMEDFYALQAHIVRAVANTYIHATLASLMQGQVQTARTQQDLEEVGRALCVVVDWFLEKEGLQQGPAPSPQKATIRIVEKLAQEEGAAGAAKDETRAIEMDFALDDGEEHSWDVCGEWTKFFTGIQFAKRLFRNVPDDVLRRWVKMMPRILHRYYLVLTRADSGKNDIKYLKGADGHLAGRVTKCRLGGNYRLLWYLSPGKVFNILGIVSHDDQEMFEAAKGVIGQEGRLTGYVYWAPRRFLRRLYSCRIQNRYARHSLETMLIIESRFNYDETQRLVVKKAGGVANLSVVGNAGSGKSVVGFHWISKRMEKQEHCLYLTMSSNLVDRISSSYHEEMDTDGQEKTILPLPGDLAFNKDWLIFEDIFSFLHKVPKVREREAAGEIRYMNPQESFHFFRQVCQNIKTGWGKLQEAGMTQDEKIMLAWRKIHGIIKGCIPDKNSLDYNQEPLRIRPRLSQEEYIRRERDVSKHQQLGEQARDFLYKQVLSRYEQALKDCHLGDDNDLARYVLHASTPRQKWQAAFLDECQDLTEVELLSLGYHLKHCAHKLMASDRCQIIQPTLFDPAQMLTDMNRLGKVDFSSAPAESRQSQYLHYNYRSTQEIVAFQNFIMARLARAQSLHEEEKVPIRAMEHMHGEKPVWIKQGRENAAALQELLTELNETKLMPLIADRNQLDEAEASRKDMDDMAACKGLEYPSVLLVDICSDMYRTSADTAWPWRYFYVGATRAQKKLVIYENRELQFSPAIHNFAKEAAEKGVIAYCEDLQAVKPGSSKTWRQWLFDWLSDITQEDRIVMAENYEQAGRFQAAADIYHDLLAEGYEEEYIRCQGRAYLEAKQYEEAGRLYGQSAHARMYWEDMLQHYPLPGASCLAIAILLMKPEEPGAWRKLRERFQADRKDEDWQTCLQQAVAQPEVRRSLALWQQAQWRQLGRMAEETLHLLRAE
ncbi:hypothetical protein [Mitsuokella sp. AF33-22]|uniref:hypothetical protein n=1 Tax=Mitsuokella sp. AF33-22 TaxID=2292047 RepID=UPI0011C4589F|nr:hypothetical protein [Mitsuokella sp. AF33-22]